MKQQQPLGRKLREVLVIILQDYLTLLLYYPRLECLVLCTRRHGILGRGQ